MGPRWLRQWGGHPAPDRFREGLQAIVQGELDPAGILVAARLTVKCPSSYEAPGPGKQPKDPSYYEQKY